MSGIEALNVIWERADAPEPLVLFEDVAALSPESFTILLQLGVLRLQHTTHTVICDACPDGHFEEVVIIQFPEPRTYLWCPHAGRVQVPMDRLRQWTVDFRGIAECLVGAMDTAGTLDEIVPDRLWSLGTTRMGGRSREVFLARGTKWPDAATVFQSNERLNASRGSIILLPGQVPAESFFEPDRTMIVLCTAVTLREDRLVFNNDHVESQIVPDQRRASVRQSTSYPTPPGTTWHQVILVVSDRRITIEVHRKQRSYDLAEAGFGESKTSSGHGDAIWTVLQLFARLGGQVLRSGHGEKRHQINKQYVSMLRSRLRSLIPDIVGDPIEASDEHYKMLCAIRSENGLTIEVPSDTTWFQIGICSIPRGMLQISVPSIERGGSHEYQDGGSERIWRRGAAARSSLNVRKFPLRILGLADEEGVPNDVGRTLLSILGSNGTLTRESDDDDMLSLCGGGVNSFV